MKFDSDPNYGLRRTTARQKKPAPAEAGAGLRVL